MVTFANAGSVRLSWVRPCGNHAKRCMNEDNSVLAKPLTACTHLSSTVSQLFEPQVQKIAVSRTAAHIFVSPGDAPVPWIERQFNACQTHHSMYLSIFNSFRVIRCLSQCVSPKIAIFTTCWSPLGTPLGQ